jgi:hypothetical protein
MLRNYINDAKENTIIMNRYLVTKPIETSNLTVKSTRTTRHQNRIIDENKCEVFRIVIHINNNFNPTNIKLLNNKTQVHFYLLEGDQTLHINLNLSTFFNILTTESDQLEIKKSIKDYGLSNSKLS